MISNLSDSPKSWIAQEHDRPTGMQVRLLKRTVVLPWSQFIHAEGDNEKIRIAFSTHDIVVAGYGLDSLLEDLSDQRVSLLREPVRAGRFNSDSDPRITSISIQRVE
jgi:hypothetical protein